MRTDRKTNKFVLIASIFQMVLSFVIVGLGAAIAIVGYLKPDNLFKLKDFQFFTSQKGIIELQEKIFGGILLNKYACLYLGCAIAAIGVIALIFAFISLMYCKKFKVARRRFAVLLYSFVPLAVSISAFVYYFLEREILTNNFKYGSISVGIVFALIALMFLLGVIFSRSEQFMSNDNNKYAFDNSAIRTARVNINNSDKAVPLQASHGATRAAQPQPRPTQLQARPNQAMPQNRVVPSQPRPAVRPAGQPLVRTQAVQPRPAKPINQNSAAQSPQNTSSIMSRPAGHVSQTPPRQVPKPATTPVQPARPVGVRCLKCGLIVNPKLESCPRCNARIIK